MTSANLHNYGDRDAAIHVQTYSPVRKLEGLPHDLFANYWRDVHGPLCSRLPGLGFYVQHHFSRVETANLWPVPSNVKKMDLVLDGAVEIGFANTGNQGLFVEASPILFGDEFNLFGHDLAYYLPNGSKTFVDRQADGAPNGPDKIHRLHLHLNGSGDEIFRKWATDFAGKLAANPAILKLRLHLPERYDNDHPQPPSPGVDHFVEEHRKDLAIIEIGFETALSARAYVSSKEYKALEVGLADHVKTLGAFFVTDVYTFVRDGKPTLAGLRGCRQAEIIARIGAFNQTQPEVSRLFVQDK